MEKKIEEEVITITTKYIYNDSGSFPYKKERTVKAGDIIVYTDSMPIDADVSDFDTLLDKLMLHFPSIDGAACNIMPKIINKLNQKSMRQKWK